MRKIALQGLRGEKRNTVLLWCVVCLSILFLSLSTTLVTSLRKTDELQRIDTYGKWQTMVTEVNGELAEEYAACGTQVLQSPLLTVSSVDSSLSVNDLTFTVHSPMIQSLGNLKLKEGHWPEEENELALEYAQALAMGIQVGDTVSLARQVELQPNNETRQDILQRNRQLRDVAMAVLEEKAYSIWMNDKWEEYDAMSEDYWGLSIEERFFAEWKELRFLDYYQSLFDSSTPALDEMTEVQFRNAFQQYLRANYMLIDLDPFQTDDPMSSHADLIGFDDINVRITIRNGKLTMTIPYTYTVCGIIETYSDRWDSGLAELPTGYITESNYTKIQDCQAKVLDKYSSFQPISEEYLVLSTHESPLDLWERQRLIYNEQLNKQNIYFATTYITDSNSYYWQFKLSFQMRTIENDVAVVEGWLYPLADQETKPNYVFKGPIEEIYDLSFNEIAGTVESLEKYDFCLDSAYVLFVFDGKQYAIQYNDFVQGEFSCDGAVPVKAESLQPEDVYAPEDHTTLRFNRMAFPPDKGNGNQLILSTIVAVFITSAAAVFQICFVQMRHRLHRIVLMKSIGAENRQIAELIVWEFIYVAISAIPIGAGLGVSGAQLIILLLTRNIGKVIYLDVSPTVLVSAILAGVLALAFGMSVPGIMAVGVPITGRTTRKKVLPPPRKEVRQSFFHITLRGLIVNRFRTLGAAFLCVLMAIVTLLCVFMGNCFLMPWRQEVQRKGKPEYCLTAPYAMSDRQLDEYIEILNSLEVAAEISAVRRGTSTSIDRSSVKQSLLLDAVWGHNEQTEQGYPATLICLSPDSVQYEQFLEALTIGEVSTEEFASGEQVLIAIPLFSTENSTKHELQVTGVGWNNLSEVGIDVSWYREYADTYIQDNAVMVGDSLQLNTEVITMAADSLNPRFETLFRNKQVTIGGILYYFPEIGIWPVSESNEGYQIICSPALVSALYPQAIRTYSFGEQRAIKALNAIGYKTASGYGTTDIYINGLDGVPREEIDAALLIFSRSHYMNIEFYYESSDKILSDAINNILLTGMLGLVTIILAWLILGNTLSSDIQSERSRIGILQALGVSNRQLINRQLYLGIFVASGAVLLANVLLWVGVALYAAMSINSINGLLWRYPWWLHIGVCLLLMTFIVTSYVWPMCGLCRYLPVDNIKSRK